MIHTVTLVVLVLHLLTDFIGFLLWSRVADRVHRGKPLAILIFLSMLVDFYFRLTVYQVAAGYYEYAIGATIAVLIWKLGLLYIGWVLVTIKKDAPQFFLFS